MKKGLVLLVFLVCLACSTGNITKTQGREVDFPEVDIIYQAINNTHGRDASNNLIGFVNADGSENTQVRLKYRAYRPALSRRAGGISFTISKTHPYELDSNFGPIHFLDDGGTYTACEQVGGYENFYWQVLPLQEGGKLLAARGNVLQNIDITTCTVEKILMEYPSSSHMTLLFAYPANLHSEVLLSEFVRSEDFVQNIIEILDLNSGETKEIIKEGKYASFSPDDRQITYLGKDGIYVALSNGDNPQQIVPISMDWLATPPALPIPYWSPDGNKILYHKCTGGDGTALSDYSLFIYDLEKKTETKIAGGGLYPAWIK